MSLSDSHPHTPPVILFPAQLEQGQSSLCLDGSPRFPTDLSTRAVLNHPGKPDDCFYPLLHRQWQASSEFADWPLSNFNEAESGSLTLGSLVRLAGLRRSRLLAPAPARLRVKRAIYTTTSLQVARSARLSWRTKTKPIENEQTYDIPNFEIQTQRRYATSATGFLHS